MRSSWPRRNLVGEPVTPVSHREEASLKYTDVLSDVTIFGRDLQLVSATLFESQECNPAQHSINSAWRIFGATLTSCAHFGVGPFCKACAQCGSTVRTLFLASTAKSSASRWTKVQNECLRSAVPSKQTLRQLGRSTGFPANGVPDQEAGRYFFSRIWSIFASSFFSEYTMEVGNLMCSVNNSTSSFILSTVRRGRACMI